MIRLGFRLRRVQKAKPLKKVSETDAIFGNLDEVNMASDRREDSLRISIDTKAKVDLCDSLRGGTSRCRKAVKADLIIKFLQLDEAKWLDAGRWWRQQRVDAWVGDWQGCQSPPLFRTQ